jgi:hypothetical protein
MRKLRRAVRLPKGDLPIHGRGWPLEIGGLAPVRGAVGGAPGQVDGIRPYPKSTC